MKLRQKAKKFLDNLEHYDCANLNLECGLEACEELFKLLEEVAHDSKTSNRV